MKVILFSDVPKLGAKGQVIDVAEGYARNYLLPRDLAAEANKGALARLADEKRIKAKHERESLEAAQQLAQRIETAALAVRAKAGGNGRLFGAVTNADVAEAISHVLDVPLDKHKVEIKSSIKALGSYPVEVKLHKNVVAKAMVSVVAA
ncbi:MAG: 50S ribosomal protein L9 [Vulcanimicrobiaceae bacterium]